MTTTLKLTLLGLPEIMLDEHPLVDFKRNKSQALLFYLAVTKRPHSRDALAALFWQDMPDEQAKRNLRNLLPELHKRLKPYLTITRQSVAFNDARPYSLDVELFQHTLASSQANMSLPALQAATTLYTGDFLEGFHVRDAPAFEEWLLLQRERLRELFILGLDSLIDHCVQHGKHTTGLLAASRLLLLEPWREKAHQQQMVLLAQTGERAAALAQYETCQRLLAAEFNVAPLPETTAIYQQIRAGEIGRQVDREIGSQEDTGQAEKVSNQQPQVSIQGEPVSSALRTLHSARDTQVTGHNLPGRTKLYGRQAELAHLHKWIVEEGCHLVGIFGIGGQGKTALAATFVRALAARAPAPRPETVAPQTGPRLEEGSETSFADARLPSQFGAGPAEPYQGVQVRFQRIIWQSLLNAPPLAEVMQEWFYILSDQTVTSLPTSLEQQFSQLIAYLRRQRCLLILDNLESILQGERHGGYYQPGYEAYGQLLQCLVAGHHHSCLLLTGREQPHDLAQLAEDTPAVRFLALAGLPADAGQAKLQACGVVANLAELTALVQHYSGNPLALKLVADTVYSLFDGDIAAFLQADTFVFDDIHHVLDQQFARLTPLEREIILWLAIVREPVAYTTLRNLLAHPPAPRLVLEAMRSLQRRSLLEKYDEGFGLQNVVMEYTTTLFVENIICELEDDLWKGDRGVEQWRSGKNTEHVPLPADFLTPSPLYASAYLNHYALVLAQTKEYVRTSQTRLLLQPVADHLLAHLGVQGAEQQLQRRLLSLRIMPPVPGYAAANLLHLLLQLGIELSGYDFSQLYLRQVYLRGVSLPQVNFAGADLTGTLFTEPLGRVPTVAFSPDGRLLAAGTREGTIHLWRTADQQLAQVIRAHNNSICELTFYQHPAADAGKPLMLASAGEDQVIGLWQVAEDAEHNGGLLMPLQQQRVIGVGFSADGQRLTSVDMQGIVRVWTVGNPLGASQPSHYFTANPPHFRAVAFSRDGQTLAIGGNDGRVCLWQITGAPGLVLDGHSGDVSAVAFSPDERILASGGRDGRICLWTLPQGQSQQILELTPGFVHALAFSPDGKTFASSHWDRIVRLWDVDTGHLCHTLVGHTHVIRSLAFSPDGRTLASSGSDQMVRLWDIQTGRPLYTLRGHYHALNAVALSPDGRLLAGGGYDQLIHLWQGHAAYAGAAHRALPGHKGLLHTLAFSLDGRTLASAGRDPAIYLWDVASGQVRHMLPGHTPDIYCVAFHPNGNLLASASADGTVWLWDLRTLGLVPSGLSQPANVIQANSGLVYILAFSPDGRTLASAGVGPTIRLWDLTQAHRPELVASRKTIQEAGEREIWSLAFSPDGTQLACGGTTQIHLWDLTSGALLMSLRQHVDSVTSLAFSPDGTLLVSSSDDRTVCLWDVARGTLRTVLHGHSEGSTSVAFNTDGTYVLSGSADGTIKFWDTQTGACINTLHVEGPYAGMKIQGITGVTEAQKTALKALGAMEA